MSDHREFPPLHAPRAHIVAQLRRSDSPYRDAAIELVEKHWEETMRGLVARVRRKAGWSWETLWGALKLLGSTEPPWDPADENTANETSD
ncbi:MAG: hypothetical protein WD066_18245 [Planctomycetaceae bacterium]